MTPSCKDCRYFGEWRQSCNQPYLSQKYTMPAAVTMRDLDEACGSSGKMFEERPGLIYSLVNWALRKTGMKDY